MNAGAGSITRRDFGAVLLGAGASAAFPRSALSQGAASAAAHGLVAFGELKYPADFAQFDYVRPDAPKGGRIVLQPSARLYNQNFNTFDTLNMYVLRGNGPLGMTSTFATLLESSTDETGSAYAYAASSVERLDDGSTLRFVLDERAVFHDGTPIRASDVVFSIEILRENGHENLASDLRGVESVEAEDDATILVRLAEGTGRNLPLIVAAGVPIFSAAWWEGRDFQGSLSEAPLGSGPYRVRDYRFGSYIDYERVEEFWAADLPALRGRYNFDLVRYEYYRDRNAAFQSFTAARTLFREEFTSRVWASDYNFPAISDGRVQRLELPDGSPAGGQSWFLNSRREKFHDRRIRQGIGLLFDFEWINANLMFGSFARSASFYEKTEYKAEGLPGPDELALLEPLRAQLPAEVFGEVPVPPVSDGSGRDRALSRRALDLFTEAGCTLAGGRLSLPNGEALTIEFLDDDNSFEPHHNAFIANLRRVGIEATYRVVDASQYTDRTRNFDFDATVSRFSMPLYPNDFIRQFFGSRSANSPGSYNLAGVADPAVDVLLTAVIGAATPEAFRTANRALDRLLRVQHYVIPQWHKDAHWLAFWNIYDRPEKKPLYDSGVLDTWWFDEAKARAIGMAT